MKLKVKTRFSKKKSEVKQIRSVGDIPAVIYSLKKKPTSLIVDGQEFNAVLRRMQPGHLPVTVFILSDGIEECQAIVKEIQYNKITDKVSHLDFLKLDGKKVRVRVPIKCIGKMECAGIKLGGVERQVMRHVGIECPPEHIPAEFNIDIKNANIGSSLRVKDLQGVTSDVTVLAKDHDVVVVIAKR